MATNRLKLYIDNKLKDTDDAYDEDISDGDEGIVIGRWKAGNEFAGSIDEVIIFDRALSAEEIQQLYHITGDINNDDVVDFLDYAIFGGNWLEGL